MENGALGKKFDAYPQRQFVTESININSLADHHIWSTIKTLPATLPEPSFKVRGPSFEDQGPSFTEHGPRLLGLVARSGSNLLEGVGPRLGWALRLGPRSFDGFAEAMRYSFIKASKLGLK